MGYTLPGNSKREIRRLIAALADEICERVEADLGIELPDSKYHDIAETIEDDVMEAVEEAWANA